VFFEGNGYGLSQDLGSAGSCLEEFQLVPFMQCSSSEVCRHGVRTDKSFWLAAGAEAEYTVKPMTSIDEIIGHISRCTVCLGTQYILARHSFTDVAPECPEDFSPLWQGYSYVMVTSSGVSGGGQDLASSGSCLEKFYLPTFIECLGRGTCAYYINNLDYWLAQNPDMTQPGMWGMGNVYSGLDDILQQGVARCTVCARNTLEI
jgi:integrin beta 8